MPVQMIQKSRERFKRFLQKRFSLRLHMFLILSGVFCAGLLCSKLLLELHVRSMLIRYPAAVLFSYVSFFGLVKLWLIYLTSSSGRKNSLVESGSGGGDGILSDLSLDLPGSGSGGPSFGGGGGGTFGGGGASASFNGPQIQAFAVSPPDSGGGPGSGIADSAGDAVSGIFDGDDAWVLIVLGIILAIICGAGIYLIYQAPVILSDAAFQAALSTSLIRRMKKMSDPDWMGSVFRTTSVPFLVVLTAATASAWAAHRAYPEAAKMSEVVRHLLQ